jgi:sugar O-acyltransferase (sialic acid O-acetyltransferase NeuD family)
MLKDKKLVIIGLGETADIAYQYFTFDSQYEVVAFSVNHNFIDSSSHEGLPVVDLEMIDELYDPAEFYVFIAVSYVKLNRTRKKLYEYVKAKGYKCATYISSKAFVWNNAVIGENCMVFENNVIQHKVKIGNGVILWSGNHIGHQTIVEDFVYISSHVVISGFCKIGSCSFIGVNSAFNDNIQLGIDNIVGSGSVVNKSSSKGCLLIGVPAQISLKSSYEVFNVLTEEI